MEILIPLAAFGVIGTIYRPGTASGGSEGVLFWVGHASRISSTRRPHVFV